jgi:hypothetical protein
MQRKLSSLGLALALAAGLFAATPGTALARDQTGLGIGADVSLGGLSGLALNIWVSPSIMLEAMLTTNLNLDRGMGHDAAFSIGGSFGVFGVLAGGDMTNLMLGGRLGVLGLVNTTNAGGLEDDAVLIEGDVVMRVEHWFDEHFAINAQVGVQLTVIPDPGPAAVGVPATAVALGIGATSGFVGGAGFTYYFDGADGGAPTASAPAYAPASSSAPPPSSSGSGTGTGDQGTGQPSWE